MISYKTKLIISIIFFSILSLLGALIGFALSFVAAFFLFGSGTTRLYLWLSANLPIEPIEILIILFCSAGFFIVWMVFPQWVKYLKETSIF